MYSHMWKVAPCGLRPKTVRSTFRAAPKTLRFTKNPGLRPKTLRSTFRAAPKTLRCTKNPGLRPKPCATLSALHQTLGGPADVAVGALRILLRGASALPWETIQNVLLRAARLDMNAELDAFAAGVASRQVEAPPDLASLTASLVDSPPLAKAVLDSAGAGPALVQILSSSLADDNFFGPLLRPACARPSSPKQRSQH